MKTYLTADPTTDAEFPRIDRISVWDTLGAMASSGRAKPILVCLVLCLAACAGELDNRDQFLDAGGGNGGGSDAGNGAGPVCDLYTDIQAELVAPKCGTSVCHDANAPSEGLDLVSPGAAARLVDVQSPSSSCGGSFVYVDSSAPTNSLLLDISTDPAPCSQTMPFGSATGLNAADAECLEVWIEQLIAESAN